MSINPGDPFLVLIKDFGWLGVVLWIVFDKVLPWVKDVIAPEIKAKRRMEMEELKRKAVQDDRWMATVKALGENLKENTQVLGQLGTTLSVTCDRLNAVHEDVKFNRNGMAVLLERKTAARKKPADKP
jgi:hypothetical protein